MGQLLYVILRDREDLLRHLRESFAGVPSVEIALDRRERERRQQRQGWPVERRRGERRTRDISFELKAVGWALVSRFQPEARPPAPR